MSDYNELVKALRILQDKNSLSYYKRQVCKDAAAAIEELQAEVKILKVSGREAYFEGLAADAEPKRGEWVEENRRPRSSQFVCSECHRTAYDPQPTRYKAWRKRCRYAYCPNCGAKMEVGI